jgi:hypothetical protein
MGGGRKKFMSSIGGFGVKVQWPIPVNSYNITTGNRTGVVLLNRKLEMVLYLLMYYNHV